MIYENNSDKDNSQEIAEFDADIEEDRRDFPDRRPSRPPLCAGHPTTWDLINKGTVLEGSPYPLPVFLDVASKPRKGRAK